MPTWYGMMQGPTLFAQHWQKPFTMYSHWQDLQLSISTCNTEVTAIKVFRYSLLRMTVQNGLLL